MFNFNFDLATFFMCVVMIGHIIAGRDATLVDVCICILIVGNRIANKGEKTWFQ